MPRSLLPLFVVLAGCVAQTPEIEPGTDGPRPTDAPDYVIMAASGHCLTNCPAFARENLVGQGTAARISDLLIGYGLTSVTFDYADALYNRLADGTPAVPFAPAAPVQFGFLQMLADLQDVRDLWIRNYQDATRIVLLGHSHGVVWTHTLARLRPDVTIDFLIDLDGDSFGWEGEGDELVVGDEFESLILEYTEIEGVVWDFPIEQAEDIWQVAGIDQLQDIEDIVPENVGFNLEVQGDSFALRDAEPNHRLDGSTLGIRTATTFEEHDRLDDPGSQSMDWVVSQLTEIFDEL